MSVGKILLTKGFNVGTQAQMIPTLTSTALHMKDIEAYHAKSISLPSKGDVVELEARGDR